MESSIRDRSEAEFNHGICPDCAQKLYPELFGKDRAKPPESSSEDRQSAACLEIPEKLANKRGTG